MCSSRTSHATYVQTCTTPEQARHLVDRAMRIAQAEKVVTPLGLLGGHVVYGALVGSLYTVPGT